jgi:hypothetical protein
VDGLEPRSPRALRIGLGAAVFVASVAWLATILRFIPVRAFGRDTVDLPILLNFCVKRRIPRSVIRMLEQN